MINRRVSDWLLTRDNTEEEEMVLGNDFEEELDNDFEAKRRILIEHFIFAYNLGRVKWPSKLCEKKKLIYNKVK